MKLRGDPCQRHVVFVSWPLPAALTQSVHCYLYGIYLRLEEVPISPFQVYVCTVMILGPFGMWRSENSASQSSDNWDEPLLFKAGRNPSGTLSGKNHSTSNQLYHGFLEQGCQMCRFRGRACGVRLLRARCFRRRGRWSFSWSTSSCGSPAAWSPPLGLLPSEGSGFLACSGFCNSSLPM